MYIQQFQSPYVMGTSLNRFQSCVILCGKRPIHSGECYRQTIVSYIRQHCVSKCYIQQFQSPYVMGTGLNRFQSCVILCGKRPIHSGECYRQTIVSYIRQHCVSKCYPVPKTCVPVQKTCYLVPKTCYLVPKIVSGKIGF